MIIFLEVVVFVVFNMGLVRAEPSVVVGSVWGKSFSIGIIGGSVFEREVEN